ncbi:MAG TPA: hypothetical protein VKU41_26605 [Polyangiaceae bacterium]|nr:hypothetical protein [Polyangiaceae bacterium]
MPPYRAPGLPAALRLEADDANPDGYLWPVFAVVWIASAARVALGIRLQEAFGAEATLALGALVGVPLLAWAALRRRA